MALIAALVCTVILLVVTAYFLMGSVPLRLLEHDRALDARFDRGFYDTCYRSAVVAAAATAASFAVAGRPALAAGAAALALLGFLLRRTVIPKRDALGARIRNHETEAVTGFRRLTAMTIGVNLAQLVLIVWEPRRVLDRMQ